MSFLYFRLYIYIQSYHALNYNVSDLVMLVSIPFLVCLLGCFKFLEAVVTIKKYDYNFFIGKKVIGNLVLNLDVSLNYTFEESQAILFKDVIEYIYALARLIIVIK